MKAKLFSPQWFRFWIVTVFLVTFFATYQPTYSQEKEDRAPQKEFLTVLIGCAVLVLGIVAVYLLWKLCKKIPDPKPPQDDDPPKPPPVWTNGPVTIVNPHGPVKPARYQRSINLMCTTNLLEGIPNYDITRYAFMDDVRPPAVYTNKWRVSVEVSHTMTENSWRKALSFQVFESSSGGQMWVVYRDGSNVYNCYYTAQAMTNGVLRLPVDVTPGDSEQEFYRLTSP